MDAPRKGRPMHLTVNIPPKMADSLRHIGERDEMKASDIVRLAILRFIQDDRRAHEPFTITDETVPEPLDSPDFS